MALASLGRNGFRLGNFPATCRTYGWQSLDREHWQEVDSNCYIDYRGSHRKLKDTRWKMNILLIDDDYLLAKGSGKLIERLGGHHMTITDEPKEIFRLCKAGEIDLILMDVNLPGALWENEEISGADLAKLLKKDPKTAHIPIILVTAYARSSERNSLLLTSGADDLITKPITNYEALLKLIDRLYHKSKTKHESDELY